MNNLLKTYKERTPDLVVICGDITQFGPGDVAVQILDQIPGDVLVVPGNIDTKDVNDGIKKSHAIQLQYQRYVHNKLSFIGINGVSEHETQKFYRDESNQPLFSDVDVLVTHVPPYGFQDMVFLGRHAGSKTIREIMNDVHPRLVLCGHIHENPGYTEYEKTIIVNCSMGKRGNGAIIDMNAEITVEMID